MFAPFRALLVRRGAPPALIAAGAAASLMFAATPFLIPQVADRYGVAVGTAGFISALQVLGFAASVFAAGHLLRTSRRLLVAAAGLTVIVGAASAATSTFGLLLALRFAAGVAAGLFTWLAWTDAMRVAGSMRDIAAIGPLTVLAGAPLLAWVGSVGGDRAIYALLAVSPIPAALIPIHMEPTRLPKRRHFSPSRSNVVLLIALGLLTLASSAFYVFIAAFAQAEIGLGEVALSLGVSLNALAGLIGARVHRQPESAWPWMVGVAVSVAAISGFPSSATFFVGMFTWGLSFWMAVPRVLDHIAHWSFVPEERVGDAQGTMALGRAGGPAIGALLVGSGRFGGLGVFSVVGLAGAAGLVGTVERYRSGRDRPVI